MNRCKRHRLYYVLLLVAVVGATGARAASDGSFKLLTGAEYSSGEYGGGESIHEWYVPFTAKYRLDQVVLKLTVPYLSVSAPEGSVVSGGRGRPVIRTGGGVRTTESGLGDVIAGMSYLDLLDTENSKDAALDITGKVKFGTADEDRGLGTGENDYILQFDLVKYLDLFSPYVSLGHIFRGDPPEYDLINSSYVVVGGGYRFSPVTSGSIDMYYGEAPSRTGSDQKEITAALNHRLGDSQKLSVYVIRGIDDGSPDWGVGVMIGFRP